RGSAILRELRRLGIEIALDDFGTGYSSLTYLRRLPITWVKIDRSFVSGVGSSLADAAIVEAVIDLSHALGLAVVAEGVENMEQLAELRELGADRVQGYLFSAPVLPSVLEGFISKPWAGATGIVLPRTEHDLRTESLPGHGGPRARLLLSALDAVSDAVAVFDAKAPLFENRVVYVNSAAEDLLSIDAEDVEGELFTDTFQVEAPGEFGLTKFENAARSSLVARGELSLGPKGGTMRPVDVTFTALSDSTGMQTNWLATFRDLSEKKALAADRGRLAHAIDRSGTGVALYDALTGRISYASESLETMVGREGNLLEMKPDQLHRLHLKSPILTIQEMNAVKHFKQSHPEWPSVTIDMTFPKAEGLP
ncbi:MAG: EAL domain-containing protein, partial [Proteobacteria bacterium]